ncbi:MAG TPA: glycoside hydrolase family 125 protein, partial [Longimicrobiales bacterium]
EWEHLDDWIPRFSAELGDKLRVRGTICAPAGHDSSLRGALYLLELENRGRSEREVEVALEGVWRRALRRILTERPWGEQKRVALGAAGVTLEAGGNGPALAIVSGGSGAQLPAEVMSPEGPLGEGAELAVAQGGAVRLRLARKVVIGAGKRAQAAFFLGVGPEADGALAAALNLRRIGATELLHRGRLELTRLARTPDRGEWSGLLNRALFFNYFFAVGRAVDDDRFYALSSRSPLLLEGAVFRERDALLWSLPALTLLDPWLARELLLRAFEQHSHRAGEALHYLDGAVLAPGFALDQACAYALALERYARESRDEHVREEPIVQDVLRDLDDLFFHRLHGEAFLVSTELLPSGEPGDHPYVTYDNVLVWAFCRALGTLWLAADEQDRPLLAVGAEEIEAAIWRDCTTEVKRTPVVAWSVNLQGEAAVYDDPAGSLALLPYLGFCSADDPIWQATLEFLRSPHYPLWLGDRPFPGLAARRHPGAAALAALCSDLLGPRRDAALDLLKRLPLDGLACEAWDPATGLPAHGPHHAALAGFLGWALWEALEGRQPPQQPERKPGKAAARPGQKP